MNSLELIQAEVAELEEKRAHTVLLERAARAIIEYSRARISHVEITTNLRLSREGHIEKRVTCYIVVRFGHSRTFECSTLSECLREIAAAYAPEAQKGGQ